MLLHLSQDKKNESEMSFLKEYTILAELGQGGFAKVYKVRHDTLGYIRAIRVLNEPVTDENSRTYQKFLRECKVLLRLGNGSHRNIVHIYQPRLLENHALVEMDYVDGQDLAHYLKDNDNCLPINEVLRMVEQMSSALAYCHEDIYKFCMDREADQLLDDPVDGRKVLMDAATEKRLIEKYKVIHNDIHSGNIMRREDGSFVLLDFGLAITGGDDVCKSSRHENGAVEYKAPEKWDKDALLTEQSDIYSFGVVMYEYLAGRVPFPFDKSISKTEAEFKALKAHKGQLPPPIFDIRKAYYEAKHRGEAYQKDYPGWLETAIMKCLEKDPAKRFRNGKELYTFVMRHLTEEAQKAKMAAMGSLMEENRKLREEKQDDEHRLDDLKRRNNDLELRLRDMEVQWVNDTPSTKWEIDQLAAKNKTLDEALAQSEKHVFDLETQIDKLKQKTPKRKPWLTVFAVLLGLGIGALLAWNLKSGNEEKGSHGNMALQQENEALRQKIKDLENRPLGVDEEALAKKQKEVDALEKQVKDLKQQMAMSSDEALKKKQQRIDELEGQVENLKKQLKESENEYANLSKLKEKEIEAKDKIIESKNKEIESKNKVIKAKDKEINDNYEQLLKCLDDQK